MARTKNEDGEKKQGRLSQIKQTYQITKKADPRIGLILRAAVLVPFAILLGVGGLIGPPRGLGFRAAGGGLTLAAWVFARPAERAVYGQIERGHGAAAGPPDL